MHGGGRPEIVDILARVAAGEHPMGEAIALGRQAPDAIFDLAVAVIDRFPAGGTYLDAALGWLPEARWSELVPIALAAREASRANEAALAAIEHAPPSALHPHLERLFRLHPRGGYAEAWRGSGAQTLPFLRGVLEDRTAHGDTRYAAWTCLLATRDHAMIAFALARASLARERVSSETNVHLHEVGLTLEKGALRPLTSSATWHLAFGPDYLADDGPPWRARVHPTWTAAPVDAPPMRFGGLADGVCASCGGPLHRLLELEPIPAGLGVTGLPRLDLATCLSCLGWERGAEELFHRHDEAGRPHPFQHPGAPTVPRFPSDGLRATLVRLAPTSARHRHQDWARSNGRENMHRLGGEPCWIQGSDYAACPVCARIMPHVLQLDSELPDAEGCEWLWGSGGALYVSWCDDCKVSRQRWQCT
jgi:hypothetical protein